LGSLFFLSLNRGGQFYLIGIEFHSRMGRVKQTDTFDLRIFVIDKYLYIVITKKVQVYLVIIISDPHYEFTFFV
jgi:hypothetical protein